VENAAARQIPWGKQMSPLEPPIVAFDSLSAPRELLDDDAVAP
jgi:hypothetical protein